MPTETHRDFMRPIKYGERGNLTKNIWQRSATIGNVRQSNL